MYKVAGDLPRRVVFALAISTVSAAAATTVAGQQEASPARSSTLKYPETRRGDVVDDYHGTRIADPYRWLEDPNGRETKDWVERQNEVTFAYLKSIPERERIGKRLTALWNFERYSLPLQRKGRYFFTRNDGLQNQSVLYVADSLGGEPRMLLDPNKLSQDGTVALSGMAISEDGSLLAYGLSAAGSDWQEWRVRDVATAADREDHLKWIKFSRASWAKDGGGFFYSRFDEPAEGTKYTGPNFFQKLYFHKLGTPQLQDRLVYERPDQKQWGFGGDVTDDGRYLIVTVTRGSEPKNQIFYQDLSQPGGPMVELVTGFDGDFDFVDNDGPVFWLHTDLNAPRYKLVAVDSRQPERSRWKDVIPESADVLQRVSLVGEKLFAVYLHDAHSMVRTFALDGKPLFEVALPGLGTAGGFGGRREDQETFFAFTSFTNPPTIFRHEVPSGKTAEFRKPKVDFQSDAYETRQVFFASKDGTRVPMFITHRKGLALDGSNPTLLYGYGGFTASLTPAFSVARAVWLEMGGVYAMPNLRGGGEYGREWHEAGMLDRKQNVFDDFIAAAEFLVRQKYTRPDRLAIAGGSNGGLLVGACMTQRPELFGAALPGVGVMDMLRFHKFTIGWAWVGEYGSSDDPAHFKTLRAYSPLHNLKSGTRYPATLVTTADHDDRVVPAHSFKFAAALQAAQAGSAPTLIRIETRAGHGAGTPISKAIEETADEYAFLMRALKMSETR